nr:hypothetical protein GCM10017745_57980 [Saccharothrix mutabilis subsp. capreolus]
MYEPAKSIGGSDRVRDLRIVADDLADALRRAAPRLRPADPEAHDLAVAHARTAQGLLRYHAAMASPAPDRISTLLSLRAEMMADNLLTIVARERDRGPSLLFAHNMHVIRSSSRMQVGEHHADWADAGALVAPALGEDYLVVATDANPCSEPGTLQHALAGRPPAAPCSRRGPCSTRCPRPPARATRSCPATSRSTRPTSTGPTR